MSSFIKRPGTPHPEDCAFDNNTQQTVSLKSKIQCNCGNDIYWIAEDENNNLIIVCENNLTNIGYYGD